MDITGLGSIFDFGSKLVDKFFPDKAQANEAKLKLLEMQQNGELAQLAGLQASDKQQTDVNLVEAQSPSLFKSGWRPAIGWICGLGLAYQYLTLPILAWYSTNHSMSAPPPLDMATLTQLLFGILGLGALRTLEKLKGVQ